MATSMSQAQQGTGGRQAGRQVTDRCDGCEYAEHHRSGEGDSDERLVVVRTCN